jgi:hypothetical protein
MFSASRNCGDRNFFDFLINKCNLKVDCHVHDHSVPVRRKVEQTFNGIHTQYDDWHGLRQFRTELSPITKGAKKVMGFGGTKS